MTCVAECPGHYNKLLCGVLICDGIATLTGTDRASEVYASAAQPYIENSRVMGKKNINAFWSGLHLPA